MKVQLKKPETWEVFEFEGTDESVLAFSLWYARLAGGPANTDFTAMSRRGGKKALLLYSDGYGPREVSGGMIVLWSNHAEELAVVTKKTLEEHYEEVSQ